jgi:hypothetical protein
MDEIETKDVAPVALRVSKGGRVSGKNWKAPKQATKCADISLPLRSRLLRTWILDDHIFKTA